MGTRTGRRIAIATVLVVVLLGGAFVWRDHVRLALVVERPSRSNQAPPSE